MTTRNERAARGTTSRDACASFEAATLRTRDGHRVWYAVAGAADGVPVAVLHGGPGSGSQRGALRLFDLQRVRVVLIDQRGAGQSTPSGSVRHNRTDHLIADLEALRARLGIARWGVLGGSWGAALALAYAGRCPQAVTGVVLRGLFLTSAREVRGLFVTSRRRAPREWAKLRAAARCSQPARLVACCAAILRPAVGRANEARQRAVALAWRDYENAVLASAAARGVAATRERARAQLPVETDAGPRVQPHIALPVHASAGLREQPPSAGPCVEPADRASAGLPLQPGNQGAEPRVRRRMKKPAQRRARGSRRHARKLIAKYRIQSHYLAHRCWLGERRLLSLARRASAAGVPIVAIHGARDPVCPPANLRRLARAVPSARVETVDAGHLASDPALHARVAQALAALFTPTDNEGRSMRRAA